MGEIKTKHWIEILKIFGWCLILGISFYLSAYSSSEGINNIGFMMFTINCVPLLMIYTINNLLFIPRQLFRDKRILFLVSNALFVAALLLFSFKCSDRAILELFGVTGFRPRPHTDLAFLARDLINYILMIGFVTALNLMKRLQQSEEALREADNARVKAELANLRSQINPHFLLNTLNNIYALTAFDADKAQKTIKELSLLLRYVLYDNLSDRVLLKREVEFLQNYIELMRIRLSSQVRLDVRFDIADDSATQIAPLIFISLIENAFKHGVDAERESFIEITLEDCRPEGVVRLKIRNSNNAKSESDKSGRGIGLDQVRRRLELLYAGAYSWQIDAGADIYESTIVLKV
ncbi:MAG: histidine kinase [Rikenellaceae bacterium]